jgi:HK97 gp10 family phage protein
MTVTVNRSRINSMLREPGGDLGSRLQRAGVQVQNHAKMLCPVDTGRLRASIQTTNVRKAGTNSLSVRIGSAVNYARHVELGTYRMRARPYLRPALFKAF